MAEHVYKKIEIVGSSPNGMEEAVHNALSRASNAAAAAALSTVCGVRLQLACVDEALPPDGWRGVLRLYPAYARLPLSIVRAQQNPEAIDVPLSIGDSAIAGGIIPHEVTPMAAGQSRVVSVLCFKLVS